MDIINIICKENTMKLAIIGSRTFTDWAYLKKVIFSLFVIKKITCIISGGAKGADTLAIKFAGLIEKPVEEYLPDYKRFGKSAPILRNKQIIDNSDVIVAFWDGKSKGTLNAISTAKLCWKDIYIVYYKKNILHVYHGSHFIMEKNFIK